MSFSRHYLQETAKIAASLDVVATERAVGVLAQCQKDEGRLFVLGVGGSAANASHAVNDFRKICGFEGILADRQCR